MAQTIKMVIQLRRDTAANWEQYGHIIPAEGEPCFVTDKNILKIGDGVTQFKDLEPINGTKFELAADGKTLFLEDNVLKLMGFDAAEVGAQPRKNADGNLEWVVPVDLTGDVGVLKTTVTTLQSDVGTLKTDITDLKAIVGSADDGSGTLLSRIEGLETKMDGTGEGTVDAKIDEKIEAFASNLTEDGKVNTLMELINYVESHGEEAADMASDIKTLQELVGSESVSGQILDAIAISEKKAKAIFEHAKYEICDTPVGTLVDYRDKEIRVMVPANAQFAKQSVGAGGDANSYYMTFRTYVPNDNVVGYIEHLGDKVDEEILTNFSVDEYGRRYQPTWLALAKYDEATDAWTYYGKTSTANKYIGWDYQIDWYDANGVVIESDKIRINLSNEACHNVIEPYYAADYVKEVAINGTLLDIVDGKVDIVIPEFKSSDEIQVNADGTLSIKSISFDKIAQDDDQEVVLNGGGAAG